MKRKYDSRQEVRRRNKSPFLEEFFLRKQALKMRQRDYERELHIHRRLGIREKPKVKMRPITSFEEYLEESSEELFIRILKGDIEADIWTLWGCPDFKGTDEKRRLILSEYPGAWEVLIKDKETPSDILNELFDKLLLKKVANGQVQELLAHPNFEMDEEKRKKMSKAADVFVRFIVVEDPKTSNDILNEMLITEVERIKKEQQQQENMDRNQLNWSNFTVSRYMEMVEKIKKHPNFQP